jgi:hypothetical protein
MNQKMAPQPVYEVFPTVGLETYIPCKSIRQFVVGISTILRAGTCFATSSHYV